MSETKQAEKTAKQLARSKQGECVRVVVRVRPLSTKERQDGMREAALVDEGNASVSLSNPNASESEPPKVYTFDQTYGPTSQQKEIYDKTASGIVESVLEGYNGTIFAYGQTGAGKTHTMEGCADPPELKGIIPNSFKHIFERIACEQNGTKKFLVRASYLEIYNEEIRDLLSRDPKNRLELRENVDNGVYVKDLKVVVVKSVSEIDRVMADGKKYRSVGSTLMNQTSSRSHSIFTIIVETSEVDAKSGDTKIRVGKLNLVDLAGSERQSKTGATGDRLKEATKINLSLSALGNVISALVESKSHHIPYRDSKLTRLLQDSLGGNTKTVMIANCGPADYNYDETLSTLRYANRAKDIKNKPKINEDPKDAMLRDLQEEVMLLRQQLVAKAGGAAGVPGMGMGMGGVGGFQGGYGEADGDHIEEIKERLMKEKEEAERLAQQKLRKLEEEKELSEQERRKLKEKLKKDTEQALRDQQAKEVLQAKLKSMEEKMLIGGLMMDKAAKQETELRTKNRELEEERIQKRLLARKLVEQEEERILKDERYSSIEATVEDKDKKIKKLQSKYQSLKTEYKDLRDERQREREDFLHTVRELTRQIQKKDLYLAHFIPPEELERLDCRIRWDDSSDKWVIPRLEFAGNNLCPARTTVANNRKFPETEMARRRKSFDSNPRYRSENVVQLELDIPEQKTQSYERAAMDYSVNAAISAAIANDEEEEETFIAAPENLPAPYLSYGGEDRERGGEDAPRSRPKSSRKSKSKSRRPGTASRSGRSSRRSSLDEDRHMHGNSSSFRSEAEKKEELYPSSRGLVSRDHLI